MLIEPSKKVFNSIFAFNNSSLRFEVSDSSYVVLKCIESIKDQRFVLFESFQKVSDKKTDLIYFPMNSRPSYGGRTFSINWFIEKYKGKKQLDQKEIQVLSYPFVTKLPEEYDVNKSEYIYVLKKERNRVILNFDSEIKIKKVFIEILESIYGKHEIVYSRELDYSIDSKTLFLDIRGIDLPSTYSGYITKVKGYLVLEEENIIKKMPLSIHDFNIFESIKLGDILEAMIFKHLSLYGPQTLGMLVSNIALKEKMRVKSIDVKDSCREMYDRNLLEKDDRDWNSATYFLNSKIYELYIKR